MTRSKLPDNDFIVIVRYELDRKFYYRDEDPIYEKAYNVVLNDIERLYTSNQGGNCVHPFGTSEIECAIYVLICRVEVEAAKLTLTTARKNLSEAIGRLVTEIECMGFKPNHANGEVVIPESGGIYAIPSEERRLVIGKIISEAMRIANEYDAGTIPYFIGVPEESHKDLAINLAEFLRAGGREAELQMIMVVEHPDFASHLVASPTCPAPLQALAELAVELHRPKATHFELLEGEDDAKNGLAH